MLDFLDGALGSAALAEDTHPVVLVCLLGSFRLLTAGRPVPVRIGGKTEALLAHLALAGLPGVPREVLLHSIWPHSDRSLAGQALNSLVHSLRVLLGAALGGVSPVVQSGGHYRLNEAAGVAVDVVRFQTLVARGERLERGGQLETAIEAYQRAARLHAGDLITSAGDGAQVGLERERLRALYRRVLIRLADHAFARSDYNGCLEHARQLLARDPCREDAHRLVMRCHVRLAERSQALRHYHTARAILRTELDTEPEPATIALFEQIRLDPSAV